MVDSVELMNRQFKLLIKMEKQMNRIQSKYNSMKQTQEKNNKTEEEAVKVAKNRSQAVTMLTKRLEEQDKTFNLIGKSVKETANTFKEFQQITGQGKFVAGLEYMDLLLSGTSQNIKVMGIEVATARKIMYGFLPPGMFRLVNKLSTGIRFTTQTIRSMNSSGEEANNIFTKLFRGFGKVSGLGNIMKATSTIKQLEKGIQTTEKKRLFGEISGEEAKRRRTGMQKGIDRLRPQTGARAFARLAVLGDMFEKGGALSLRKGDRVKRRRKAAERFRLIKENLLLIAEASWKIYWGAAKMFVKVGLMSMRFLILFFFYAALAFVILKPLMPALKEAFNWAITTFAYGLSQVWEGLGFILEGVMMVFGAIFGGGTAQDLLMGLWNVAWGVGKVLWGVISIFLGTIPALLLGLGAGILKSLEGWFNDLISGGDKAYDAIINGVLLAAGIVMLIKGIPILLIAVALLAVKALADYITPFADGGTTTSGLSLVGERGPELVKLPSGSRVYSNKDSKTMLSNSNGGNTFNITINARDTSDTELRRIADKIGQMINNKVTRSVSTTTTF